MNPENTGHEPTHHLLISIVPVAQDKRRPSEEYCENKLNQLQQILQHFLSQQKGLLFHNSPTVLELWASETVIRLARDIAERYIDLIAPKRWKMTAFAKKAPPKKEESNQASGVLAAS